jgi:Domain of unknown function (DUF202)
MPKEKRPVLQSNNTDLALERTVLPHELSLMAWIRTAISMFSIGFTIYRFFRGYKGDLCLLVPARVGTGGCFLGPVQMMNRIPIPFKT